MNNEVNEICGQHFRKCKPGELIRHDGAIYRLVTAREAAELLKQPGDDNEATAPTEAVGTDAAAAAAAASPEQSPAPEYRPQAAERHSIWKWR
jgi:hypothetical protein